MTAVLTARITHSRIVATFLYFIYFYISSCKFTCIWPSGNDLWMNKPIDQSVKQKTLRFIPNENSWCHCAKLALICYLEEWLQKKKNNHELVTCFSGLRSNSEQSKFLREPIFQRFRKIAPAHTGMKSVNDHKEKRFSKNTF